MARKNPWLNSRIKKMVKPHIRVTKKGGVEFVESFMHDYPKKVEAEVKSIKSAKKEEKVGKVAVNKKKSLEELRQKARCLLGLPMKK